MIESCFGNHLNVQHATDYMGAYLMYLWAINVIVIIDSKNELSRKEHAGFSFPKTQVTQVQGGQCLQSLASCHANG